MGSKAPTHNPERLASKRLPKWIRRSLRTNQSYVEIEKLLSEVDLNTVCSSANCPNRLECWNHGTATFMLLGNICTRNCHFCDVQHGEPSAPDQNEPQKVITATEKLGLAHLVLTSVTRDDLPDGGANHFAKVVDRLREELPHVTVEVLTSDFRGDKRALEQLLAANPDIFGHNLETVERLQIQMRPSANYATSLKTLRRAACYRERPLVKSGLMLGMGEKFDEIDTTLDDLLDAGCEIVTLGQYLSPSPKHPAPRRYLPPEEFQDLAELARQKGFSAVAAAPLVRSSYRAEQLARETLQKRRRTNQ